MDIGRVPIGKSLSSEIDIEVISVCYDTRTLEVTVAASGHVRQVIFNQPGGFRVLDEGDLLEFWPECSTPNGWLFEIYHGGWKSLESTRPGFTSGDHSCKREYLIVGCTACVSVLSFDEPEIV